MRSHIMPLCQLAEIKLPVDKFNAKSKIYFILALLLCCNTDHVVKGVDKQL